MYSEEEIKCMDVREANEKLGQEEFEVWRQFQRSKLEEQAEDNVKKWQERDENALDIIKSSVEDKLIEEIDVMGAKLKVDVSMNKEQQGVLKKFKQIEQDIEDGDEIDNIQKCENIMYELLGSVTVEYSKNDWRDTLSDVGFKGLRDVVEGVMEKYMNIINENQEVVRKFRNQ